MTSASLDLYHKWSSEPLRQRPKISVIIPAYNEAIRIVPTIGAIAAHVSSFDEPWELIVADDGSTDDTVDLVEGLELPNLLLLRAKQNGGKGKAVRRGVSEARGDIILFADADQSTPIEQFDDLEQQICAGADVAVGSRSATGADVKNKSFMRNVFSKGLSFAVRGLLRLPVTDTQCGFKMFTADAAANLFSLQIIDDFSFDLELLFLAKKQGLRVAEVPVSWTDAPGSKVSAGKVALEFVRDLAVIRINNWRGVYDQENHTLSPQRIRSWETASLEPNPEPSRATT